MPTRTDEVARALVIVACMASVPAAACALPSAWDPSQVHILGVLAVLLAQTALIAVLLVQRSRRRQAEATAAGDQVALRTSSERIHHLAARLLNAQEVERASVARVLHDDISQQLALLMIDLELLSTADPATTEALIEGAVHRAHALARSVSDLSHRMYPARLRLIGLVAALRGLQQELARPDVAITFTHDDVPSTLQPDRTLCVFRIAQEALQNALKHSGARHVTMHLTNGSKRLALTVVDDGVGFDVDAAWGKGLGLISMSERLAAIGGTVDIRSQPGAGTRVTATAPL